MHEHSHLALNECEQQMQELVRIMPDGILILAEEQIAYVSENCAKQFRCPPEALLHQTLGSLVAEPDYSLLLLQLQHPAALPPPAPTPRIMRRCDSTNFCAAVSVGDVRHNGRPCKLLVIRDFSETEHIRDALASSHSELQAMTRRLLSLQEDERRAISRDLHDDIGQAITAIKLSAHAALNEEHETTRQQDLQEIINLSDSTITKLRNLSMLLRPPQLDALGLEAALRSQASMLFRSSSPQLQLRIHPLQMRPSNEIEQACFRIAQESLTNVLRHARAKQVVLTLHQESGHTLYLEVNDDGCGFDTQTQQGLGLIVMRERARSAAGSLEITSTAGAGTRITLRLPYYGNANENTGR